MSEDQEEAIQSLQLVRLMGVNEQATKRLCQLMEPDAKNMDENQLLSYIAFATVANTWMTSNALLIQAQAMLKRQEAENTPDIEIVSTH